MFLILRWPFKLPACFTLKTLNCQNSHNKSVLVIVGIIYLKLCLQNKTAILLHYFPSADQFLVWQRWWTNRKQPQWAVRLRDANDRQHTLNFSTNFFYYVLLFPEKFHMICAAIKSDCSCNSYSLKNKVSLFSCTVSRYNRCSLAVFLTNFCS